MSLWIDNPAILLSTDLSEWNPLCGTAESKINATTKLTILVAIASSMKMKDHKIFQRTIIALGVIMVVYIGLDARGKPSFTQPAVKPVQLRPPGDSESTSAVAPAPVIPSDQLMVSTRASWPHYNGAPDNDQYKEKMYGDTFKCHRKQGSVYSHLACPPAACNPGRHGFSGVSSPSV